VAETKRALLAGATGLIGGFCLLRLLADPSYSEVKVWSRRPIALSHRKLSVELMDFSRMPVDHEHFDRVFCCLGTTIGKAGSRKAFKRVDHDYPLALARYAKSAGAGMFLMVSALGANAGSRVFYNRVKGETENAISEVGLPGTIFFRPSLLLGPRRENRIGEKLGIMLSKAVTPLLIGRLSKYRPIEADAVAAAMIYAANHDLPSGVIESGAIEKLAALDQRA
jgi:uncharacterized protein YbjT (DUF2867 family)